jgi:aryl-alcohol dehydrogenase-like predicted oxidoreductase
MTFGTVPQIGKPVSRIGQGCMMLGSGEKQAESNRILDTVWETGVRLFDHSHIYGGGDCERAFGAWLRERGRDSGEGREEVVILDKGCHPLKGRKRVTPQHIREDLAGSLGRLGVSCVDLWLFHRDDPEHDVGPLVETLNELQAAGKVRAFGGSNWTHTRIEEANEYAYKHGLTPFVASSPNFSLAEQVDSPWGPDCVTISGPSNADARRWYAEHDLAVFTWSSLARGFLSGRMRRDNFEAVRDEFEEHTIRCYVTDDNWERLDRAAAVAADRGLSVAQVALAFVLHQPLNIFALIGAYSAEEARANLQALDATLTREEIDWLDLRNDRRPERRS